MHSRTSLAARDRICILHYFSFTSTAAASTRLIHRLHPFIQPSPCLSLYLSLSLDPIDEFRLIYKFLFSADILDNKWIKKYLKRTHCRLVFSSWLPFFAFQASLSVHAWRLSELLRVTIRHPARTGSSSSNTLHSLLYKSDSVVAKVMSHSWSLMKNEFFFGVFFLCFLFELLVLARKVNKVT